MGKLILTRSLGAGLGHSLPYSGCALVQQNLYTEEALHKFYRRIDSTEARKHWEFWYKHTEEHCSHGYSCSM